ncbi:MAG: RsmD family RNA methyltransferase [Flavobacteriaceae bacterium]|nr:RsmD family RNA methyltransferase [Flavobacteriaceae bacterium]
MENKILLPEIQRFIIANLKTDLHALLLKKSPFSEVSMREIVRQIKGKNTAEKKMPFLLKENIIFPTKISLEQSSSEVAAKYKSGLISGKKFLDLTCGFGIDAYFISENFEENILVEKNSELVEIVEHNWKILGKKAKFVNQDLHQFLKESSEFFDAIYLDPARRNESEKKVFLLEDLSPNVLEIQEKLMQISDKILLKLSPLIDLKYLISTLKNIAEIHIVAVKNDVKEILVLIRSKEKSEKIKIKAANLETDEPDFQFNFNELNHSKSIYSEPEKFIFIPNSAVLKSGAFDLVSEKFGLKKLHPNTHLYTSNQIIKHFPGRVLEMKTIDSQEIKKGETFNIISKNHPLKPEEIKKKYGLKDGGNQYLIFTQTEKGKIILKSL